MIWEYDFKITVEINAKDEEEEKALVKQFKRKLHETFPSGSKIAVEGLRTHSILIGG